MIPTQSRLIQSAASWKDGDAVKRLYALYIADNQITFQKVTIFFAVNGFLGALLTGISKISTGTFFSELPGVIIGTAAAFFGAFYTVVALQDVSHTHKYRIWYRDQIEKPNGVRTPNLFPTQEQLREIRLVERSKTANRFRQIFYFIGICWAIAFAYFAVYLFRHICLCDGGTKI